jgi:hypothetical protein
LPHLPHASSVSTEGWVAQRIVLKPTTRIWGGPEPVEDSEKLSA